MFITEVGAQVREAAFERNMRLGTCSKDANFDTPSSESLRAETGLGLAACSGKDNFRIHSSEPLGARGRQVSARTLLLLGPSTSLRFEYEKSVPQAMTSSSLRP